MKKRIVGLEQIQSRMLTLRQCRSLLILVSCWFLSVVLGTAAEAGGPKIEFCAGRTDAESGATSDPQDRLPGADKGSRKATAQHVRDVSAVSSCQHCLF